MGGQFVVDLLRQRFKLFNKIIEAICPECWYPAVGFPFGIGI